jgi:hypothetical protein
MHDRCARMRQRPTLYIVETLRRRSRQGALLSCVLATGAAITALAPAAAVAHRQPGSPTASQALSNTYVKEQGHLKLSSKSGGGDAIAEQGSATGTFNAGLDINLVIKISKVTGSFVAYLKGGSISGYASAVPHISGQWVSFKGSLTIDHGTGSYRGASGTASLYGSLNRIQLKLNVQVIGRLRL